MKKNVKRSALKRQRQLDASRRDRDAVTQLQPAGLNAWFTRLWPGMLIVLSGTLVYSNSFGAPFLYDDILAIRDNPAIRRLWPPGGLFLTGLGGETVSGRPLLSWSFAVNYALGGLNVRGYHAVNLLIHLLAGLTLFGVIRRTLLRPVLAGSFGTAARPLAFCTALLWTLHPLQTESVTYLAQRAESLAGLFYLLTLYCFIRGVEGDEWGLRQAGVRCQNSGVGRGRTGRRWYALAMVVCMLGVLSKEVLATAPLVVLLYDRTFGAGSFAGAWRARRGLHLALFASWLPLAGLIALTGGRGGTVGFEAGVSLWEYALIQCWAIILYLKLCLWPHPLVFDYGVDLSFAPVEAIIPGTLLALLLGGTLLALKRWPALGFAGACCFLILAPSSSVVPVATELAAEHRMYLPLAAVLGAAALGLYSLLGARSVAFCLLWAAALGGLTFVRNRDYQSSDSIWSDTLAKTPPHSRALTNAGIALAREGRLGEAIELFQRALRVNPEFTDALSNLAAALTNSGKPAAALPVFERAFKVEMGAPNKKAELRHNYGRTLAALNRLPEAIAQYRAALEFRPEYADAEHNLGAALYQLGRVEEALPHFERALRIKPDFAEAQNGLGGALAGLGRLEEARGHFEAALRLRPEYAEARQNLEWLSRQLELARQSPVGYHQP